MSEQPAARQWVVQGRVQGVGYRWFVKQQATGLGLLGWVSNRDDGSVEVVASGNPQDLEKLEGELRRGPPGARVTNLASQQVPHEAVDTKSFNIKH